MIMFSLLSGVTDRGERYLILRRLPMFSCSDFEPRDWYIMTYDPRAGDPWLQAMEWCNFAGVAACGSATAYAPMLDGLLDCAIETALEIDNQQESAP